MTVPPTADALAALPFGLEPWRAEIGQLAAIAAIRTVLNQFLRIEIRQGRQATAAASRHQEPHDPAGVSRPTHGAARNAGAARET